MPKSDHSGDGPEETQSDAEILNEFGSVRTPWYQDAEHTLNSDSAALDSLLCLSAGIQQRPLTIKVDDNMFMLAPTAFSEIDDLTKRLFVREAFSKRIDLVNGAIRAGVLTAHPCGKTIAFNPKEFFTWARAKRWKLPKFIRSWLDSLPHAANAPTPAAAEAVPAEAAAVSEAERRTARSGGRKPGRPPRYDDGRDRRVWAMWRDGRYKTFDAFVKAYKKDLHEDYNSSAKMRKLQQRMKKNPAE